MSEPLLSCQHSVMSQALESIPSSSWDLNAAALPQPQTASPQPQAASSNTVEQSSNNPLDKAYQKALSALNAAYSVVSGIASVLYDLEKGQKDVSARLSERPARYIGRKRKLSPSVYDYSASNGADTPTQEVLPASRTELRFHQIQAVKWLASLERNGAGGVLADELLDDRRAAVAGLLSYLAATPPSMPLATEAIIARSPQVGPGAPLTVVAPPPLLPASACVLLAPACRLGDWAEAIQTHVEVEVCVMDGSEGAHIAFQQASCPGTPTTKPSRLGSSGIITQPSPLSGFPATHLHYQPSPRSGFRPHLLASPMAYRPIPPPPKLRVILAPLENLSRDLPLLARLSLRLLVVDLAAEGPCGGCSSCRGGYGAGSGGSAGGAASDGVHGSSDWGHGLPSFASGLVSGSGSVPGSASGSKSGYGPGLGPQRCAGVTRGSGMVLEGPGQLQLLECLRAGCRVLLSAGLPKPAGDGIWLLLMLLAPAIHRPLWSAIKELQQAVLADQGVEANYKEGLLSEVRGRLWGLLQLVALHRRARDVDLNIMRTNATNLNLYDHFSAAKADGS